MPIFQTYPAQSINLKGRLMTFDRPKIMGILNLTPDSFYDGGKYTQVEAALIRAQQILEEGADIIDIGAYSTRPGAKTIDAAEEIDRAVPIIEAIAAKYPEAILSID